jgi:hypothetical protein
MKSFVGGGLPKKLPQKFNIGSYWSFYITPNFCKAQIKLLSFFLKITNHTKNGI